MPASSRNARAVIEREYHYYGQDKAVETRNGSDQTLKQQVWGIQYVDRLVQVAVNVDPTAEFRNLTFPANRGEGYC